jgi:hypothetical protein
MSAVVERLESQIDVAVANGVRWGSRSALVAAMLHFPELDTDLEVLVFGRCTRLIEDEVDSLWSRVHAVADSLARSFLLQLPVMLLTAQGSSGGSLCR